MQEIYHRAEVFLDSILTNLGFSVQASVQEVEDGCKMDFSGEDVVYLRGEGGEVLEALEHIVNQAFSHELPKGKRIICDVEGFRSIREAELRAMAQHAANQVRSTGTPFVFGPMEANERRVIHLALAEDNSLQTESVGEGNARRLKISPKVV